MKYEELKEKGLMADLSGICNPNEYEWEVGKQIPVYYPVKKIHETPKYSEDSCIDDVEDGWQSGGNIFLDFITLKDGTIVVISEDAISLHLNRESFDEGDKPIFFKERPTLYQVISPDGFAFHPTDVFTSVTKAWEKFRKDYKKRYEYQGYYSSVNHGRIDLRDLADYCSVKPI